MAMLTCPECGFTGLEERGEPSLFDRKRGFRCNRCGIDLAPPRDRVTRGVMFITPFFGLLLGIALPLLAIHHFVQGLGGWHQLGFLGVLAFCVGWAGVRRILPELRRPMPYWVEDWECSQGSQPAPSVQPIGCPPQTTEPTEPDFPSDGSVLRWHVGLEGAWSGLGCLFPVIFIASLVLSMLLFDHFRKDPVFWRSVIPEAVAAVATTAGCWLIGRYLNRGRPHRFVESVKNYRDPATGEVIPGTLGHTCGGVRLEYCGVCAFLFCICYVLYRMWKA